MNAVCILLDSLNRHFLPAYGNDWVLTPNLQRLQERAVTFDRMATVFMNRPLHSFGEATRKF